MIWLVAATARPSSTRKPVASAATGTPLASASSPSTEAKKSGLPIATSAASTATVAAAEHAAPGRR